MAGLMGGYILPQGGGVVAAAISGGATSGASFAETLLDGTFLAAEPISGGGVACGAAFTQSGTLLTAMASVSGRMPAVGIVISNVLSGTAVTLYRGGRVFAASLAFSGWMDQPVYVGRSGQLVASGAPTTSGDVQQIVGVTLQQSGMMVQLGDALEPVLAASGDLGSGSVYGQAGGGQFVIASGSVATYDLASGAAAARALFTAPIFSGTGWTVVTAENVSGFRAVAFNQSGQLQVAMAATSGRVPAVGLVIDNVLSGIQANVYTGGFIQPSSGMSNFSGYTGQRLWLGRSGQVTTISGSWSSAGFASGDVGQILGTAATGSGGAVLLNVGLVLYSGGPLGQPPGGPY